ncbi:MAG: hypothetical protein MNSN_03940 [Minisyncoccus archaeiphilus]|jgi:Fic family protein|uniref:Fic family protein n=1 Tax=Minisyncoccus archaeiphilus TaxID=3238481 RepID=UPI002B178241|nr:MAG: hypothetical protein MNSN_03940 [Candidatus Parcubacteria bacterium]
MISVREKIKIIQKISGLSQQELSQKIGVSFVSLNKWVNGKSIPRESKLSIIDEIYLELTGEKVIPENLLTAKKGVLINKSKKYKNILKDVLGDNNILDELILKLTFHSNAIEGSTLDERETAAIMFRDTVFPNKTLVEHLEVRNHQTAIKYLLDYLKANKEINMALVLKLHSILMNGVRPDAGSYRNHSVRIIGSNIPTANYLKVYDLMEELISEINTHKDDIIHHICDTHARFEQIHPFSDGNGRIGRLIILAMLINHNLAPAIIRQEKKQLYYTFLNILQQKGKSDQLEDFLCDAIAEGFDLIEND